MPHAVPVADVRHAGRAGAEVHQAHTFGRRPRLQGCDRGRDNGRDHRPGHQRVLPDLEPAGPIASADYVLHRT
jgi:hypothetical protein